MNNSNRIRWLLKLGCGVIIGLAIAFILGANHLYLSVALGTGFTILGAALCFRNRNKIVSCVLASCMAVSPNLFGSDTYGGFNGQQCYCFTPQADEPEPEQHVVVMDFILDLTGPGEVQPRIVSMHHPDPSVLVSYDEMNQSLAAWGIDLNGGEQYAKNGQPATVLDMPFTFGQGGPVIYPDRPQYRVVIEVATELGEFTFWQALAHLSVPSGVRIQLQDSPEGPQTFYRVRLEQTPEDFQAQGAILLGCGLGLLAGTAFVSILTIRACARNKKKFDKKIEKLTNDVDRVDMRLN